MSRPKETDAERVQRSAEEYAHRQIELLRTTRAALEAAALVAYRSGEHDHVRLAGDRPMTHYCLADQLTGPRGLTRALCGALAYPHEQAIHPTCVRCAALADEREEEIPKFLREDNDARRI